MKKTLLATAIAGALGASAAAQAATVYNQDGTQLDIYGNIQIAYYSLDAGDESVDEIADNGSTFGFAAQHVINDGLTGYLKLEFDDFKADEIKVRGRDAGDQAYVGLKGNFGDARLGSYDPLIDDWIQDPITNNEFADVSDSSGLIVDIYGADDREGDKFQYTSPSFGGLQFAVGTQYKGDAEEKNAFIEADGRASFFSGVKYTVGAFSIAGVYDNLAIYDGEFNTAVDVDGDGTADIAAGDDFEAGDQYGVTAQYTMGALRVALKYERYESEVEDVQPDVNFYGIGARYGYGMGDIYAAYQYVDIGGSDLEETIEEDDENIGENDDSRNEILVGVTYNVSPAMYVWLEGGVRDQEDDLGDFTATGVTYSF
ncbi:Outer membrane protein (porin) [Modicisalibacter muralis]|uniref:Outer membrane protein (Porin) n=1 Tax=Modicisalibacter muralis TaxID=119000 RepID=A0A1G9RNN3_9GAMM|nr:porin [Halomonas muralis]SDM23995.1 Outer membrane protein (porin) [Halomonas muralis]